MNTRWAWTDLASLVWIPVKVPRSILPPKPQNVVTVFFKQTEKTVWFLEQSFHCHFRSFDRNEKSVLKSSVFNEDHNNSWYLNRNARFFLKTRISALNHVTVNDVTVRIDNSLGDHCPNVITFSRRYVKLQLEDFSLATASKDRIMGPQWLPSWFC